MSRRRDSQDTAVSLFPFLAVLICTIGALTVALMLLSRQARIEAQTKAMADLASAEPVLLADEEPETPAIEPPAADVVSPFVVQETPPAPTIAMNPPEPEAVEPTPAMASVNEPPAPEPQPTDTRTAEEQLAELQAQARQIEVKGAEVREAMQQQRLQLSHIEDHIRSLQNELAQAQVAQDTLERSDMNTDRDRLMQHMAELRQILADKQKALDDARETLSRGPAFAVVPFEGKFQTYRPPLYIECTADGVIIQPHGIELSSDDFDLPLGPGNPLASAVRAMSEYLVLQGSPDGRANGQPYPLLLVRPDGIPAYYAAREALQEWDTDFGYELVDKEWPLAFPQTDPKLGALAREAVLAARARQEERKRRMPLAVAESQGPRPQRFRAGSSLEGAVPVSEGSGDRGDVIGRARRPDGPTPDRPNAPESAPEQPGVGGLASGGGSAMSGSTQPQGPSGTGGGPGTTREPDARLSMSPQGGSLGDPNGTGGGNMTGEPPADLAGTTITIREPGTSRIEPTFGNPPGQSGTSQPASSASDSNSPSQTAQNENANPRFNGSPNGTNEAATMAQGSAGQSGQQGGAGNVQLSQEQQNAECRAISEVRGEDWALPVMRPGTIGVERVVRVRVQRNSIQVLPDGPVRPMDSSVQENIDDVVADISRQARNWGVAGPSMYWKPTLRVDAAPDAQPQAEQLRTLLDGSGLGVQMSPARASNPQPNLGSAPLPGPTPQLQMPTPAPSTAPPMTPPLPAPVPESIVERTPPVAPPQERVIEARTERLPPIR
jgi:hypothetical protein